MARMARSVVFLTGLSSSVPAALNLCIPAAVRIFRFSVDRPRCQPGLRKEADFGLYAAVRFLLADRLAPEALRPLASQLLSGDPLRYSADTCIHIIQ
jgi:hypothetical protein